MILKNLGFTLVELAIVIIIIGLLIGGVLQGQELIQAAKRQSIMKWFTQFEAAHASFRGKYNCIAGDCPKATLLFGNSSTTNGNGNLKISDNDESLFAIEQLSLGNFLSGKYLYTGTSGQDYRYQPCINTPCPVGELSGFQLSYYGPDALYSQFYAYNKKSGNTVNFAGVYNATSASLLGGTLTPEEAYIFDQKFDDGIPDNGKIFGGGGHRGTVFQSGCVSNHWSSTNSGPYQTQNAGKLCILVYFID